MDADSVMNIGRQAMEVTMLLAAPILLASLAVGLIVAMFQAATQINEMTLVFIPKMLAVGLAQLMAGQPDVQKALATGDRERLQLYSKTGEVNRRSVKRLSWLARDKHGGKVNRSPVN